MAIDTEISWADSTANFWTGCTKISPACDHCYAEELMAVRHGRVEWGPKGDRIRVAAGWKDARRFQRAAPGFLKATGRRRRVFVNSLSDFFDNHRSIVWRDEAWALIRECPDVIFMLLTKRPENIAKMLPGDWDHGYPNVWLGTTVEDEIRGWHRIPHLVRVPAKVRFLSCEPLLGSVPVADIVQSAQAGFSTNDMLRQMVQQHSDGRLIHWIIAGGESGRKARITRPAWVRRLEEDAGRMHAAFHFKQWGEFVAEGQIPAGVALPKRSIEMDGERFYRIGKKASGNALDGTTYLEFPEAA